MIPYISIIEATEYFTTRINSDAWLSYEPVSGTVDARLAALVTATRAIDQLKLKGSKPEGQENQFPRQGQTEIPVAIKLATAELAYSYLDGIDPHFEYESLAMISQQYSNVRSSYDRSVLPEHIVAGVPNIVAWRYLIPYLAKSENVRLNRVS